MSEPKRNASLLAWTVFVVWAALSFSTIATTSDLWIHFKVGEDILAGEGFPVLERYSATAEGRPFVAYEWLSAVVFALLKEYAGPPGLLFLRLFAGMGCIALLYFALEPRVRRGAWVLPLLMLVTYLICFRTHLRPHLFSLVMICALCFAIERWRRTRRISDIVWLIPMHALWVNLHGAYLFGIVILAALTGLVGLYAFLAPGRAPGEPAYTKAQFLTLGGVTLASFAACLVNPYGTELVAFSLQMSEANDFIKNSIWEWRNPFLVGPGNLWFSIYCALLVLLWTAIVFRAREQRWIDFVLAGLVIFQSMRANRFIPHMAILGFPVIARWLWDLAERGIGVGWKRYRPWLEVALIVWMLATLVGPLSHWGPRQFRTLGWGYSAHFPVEEVVFIRDEGLEGTIYNEYGDGGFLIYHLHPRVRPIMDPRIDIYGPELYAEWEATRRDLNAFYAYLDKYDIELVLVRRANDHLARASVLANRPGWRVLHAFPRRVLLGRER